MQVTAGDKRPYEILALLCAGFSQADEPAGAFCDVP